MIEDVQRPAARVGEHEKPHGGFSRPRCGPLAQPDFPLLQQFGQVNGASQDPQCASIV